MLLQTHCVDYAQQQLHDDERVVARYSHLLDLHELRDSYLMQAEHEKLPPIFTSYIPFFHLYVKFWLARSGVKKNLQNVVYDHTLINDEMLYGYLQPFLEDEIFIALTRMIRDREGDLSAKELSQVHTPCLLIWGEHDKVVPLHIGKRLKTDLKKSELVVLKDTGHLVPEERPEEVYQHIQRFLKAK